VVSLMYRNKVDCADSMNQQVWEVRGLDCGGLLLTRMLDVMASK